MLTGRIDKGRVSRGNRDVYFPLFPPRGGGSRGSMVAKLKLKVIDGRAPPGVEPVA